MVGQHRYNPRSYRPSDEEYADAKTYAGELGYSINTLIRALFRRLRLDPSAVTALLAEDLKAIDEENPKGRPGPRT